MISDHGIRIELCRVRGQVGPSELRAHQLLQREEDHSEEVLQEQERGAQQDGPHSGEDGDHAQGIQVRHADVFAEEGTEREQKVLGGGQGEAGFGRARRVCD